MKTALKSSLLALALAVAASPMAQAHDKDKHHDPKPPCDPPNTAPEVDPSMAFAGLTLLGGTLTVLRSRRSK
jgi:LPXTG-motif cell wall-anchored protein